MTTADQMHLMAFIRPTSLHPTGWRYPGAIKDGNVNFPALKQAAQRLEAACLDAFFFADQLGVPDSDNAVLRTSDSVATFEPFTLLGAIAAVTECIGLVCTASTTYEEPYNLARRLASLDLLSDGRAGWNVVTTWLQGTARNFGHDAQPAHHDRYLRAREYVDVVTGLWDSFADDAFVRDETSGTYFAPERMHVLAHRGEHFSVRGPLNIVRPPQGWPVIVQAGASEDGKQFAAEVTEVIFGAATTIEAGLAFRDDIHCRMRAVGRDPAQLRVLPGVMLVIADTVEAAQAKRAALDDLVPFEVGLESLGRFLGHDVSRLDPDGLLPEIGETEAIKSARTRIVEEARDKQMTIRQLVDWVKGYRGLTMIGTAETIADEMQAWFVSGAAQGFNMMLSSFPDTLDGLVERLVPELQRRGLFRTAYRGRTLRDHLNLARPANQFFDTFTA